MKLRSAFNLASAYLIFKFLDKAFSTKVRFQSVIIEKNYLQTLFNNHQFLSLFFSSVYDNRRAAKDRIALLAHIQFEGGDQMIRHDLEILDRGTVHDNENNYSSYEIKKEDLRKLLEPDDERIVYFIFKPKTYRVDNKYVSYSIIPADADREPISIRTGELTAPRITSRQSTAHEIYGSERQTMAMMMNRDYMASMNPSPPASISFEVAS